MSYTVAIHNLGCKVNYYEAVKMQEALIQAGFVMVNFESEADIYIVNTCTVTNIADKKSRQMLNRARVKNKDSIVVAAGCYAKIASDKLKESLNIDILIDNKEKENIVEILKRELENRKTEPLYDDLNSEQEDYFQDENSHSRAFLKIQDGCDRYCSYCLIPFARNNLYSVPKEEVLKDARHMVNQGFTELVLTGIHLSSYGKDTGNSDKALSEIINEIAKIDGVKRIRLGSLEQGIITKEFLEALKYNEKLLPHFHLSLQSGSDTVLKRMNRKYTSGEFLDKCELLKKYYKKVSLTTDIIAGFPGETLSEFDETLKFIKKVRFYEAHIFPFSIRTGTRAASMTGQLPNAEKKRRADILAEETDKLRKEYIRNQVGDIEEVLIEEKVVFDGISYYKGYSKRYVPTYIRCINENIDLTGRIIRGKIIGSLKNGLIMEFK